MLLSSHAGRRRSGSRSGRNPNESTVTTEASNRSSLRRLARSATRQVPSAATSAPEDRSARLPSAQLRARRAGRSPLFFRSPVRGVDALSSFLRLDRTARRLVSESRSRHCRSEPTDFYDHEARELTFSDLRTCLCRGSKLSARKKSRSMRFCYPQRPLQRPHKLSTIKSQPIF